MEIIWKESQRIEGSMIYYETVKKFILCELKRRIVSFSLGVTVSIHSTAVRRIIKSNYLLKNSFLV